MILHTLGQSKVLPLHAPVWTNGDQKVSISRKVFCYSAISEDIFENK